MSPSTMTVVPPETVEQIRRRQRDARELLRELRAALRIGSPRSESLAEQLEAVLHENDALTDGVLEVLLVDDPKWDRWARFEDRF